jgi:hypothetical protein
MFSLLLPLAAALLLSGNAHAACDQVNNAASHNTNECWSCAMSVDTNTGMPCWWGRVTTAAGNRYCCESTQGFPCKNEQAGAGTLLNSNGNASEFCNCQRGPARIKEDAFGVYSNPFTEVGVWGFYSFDVQGNSEFQAYPNSKGSDIELFSVRRQQSGPWNTDKCAAYTSTGISNRTGTYEAKGTFRSLKLGQGNWIVTVRSKSTGKNVQYKDNFMARRCDTQCPDDAPCLGKCRLDEQWCEKIIDKGEQIVSCCPIGEDESDGNCVDAGSSLAPALLVTLLAALVSQW